MRHTFDRPTKQERTARMTPRRGILKTAAIAATVMLLAPTAAVGQEAPAPAAADGELTTPLVAGDGVDVAVAPQGAEAFGDDAADDAPREDGAGLGGVADAARAVAGVVSPIAPASMKLQKGEKDDLWGISGRLAGKKHTYTVRVNCRRTSTAGSSPTMSRSSVSKSAAWSAPRTARGDTRSTARRTGGRSCPPRSISASKSSSTSATGTS
ncbi:hypothetical protein [Corynebacterium frankenforstense]|uniref:hypothetical protein n=1 Tax=Corynebacterium frankenforstense TaxID=1230998 RepID=UPI0026EF26B5|nr:hypothetical protein [Corynebacterium frankenforstense]